MDMVSSLMSGLTNSVKDVLGLSVSILSYDGKVQFGLISDHGLVPDPERIVERFASEFDKLLMLVLMEPWGRLGDPAAVEAGLADEGA